MKKVLVVAIGMIMLLGLAGSASATNSLKAGSAGFNVGFGDSSLGTPGVVAISGAYFIADDLAIHAGIGVQGSTGDVDADYFAISGGARKYLKINDFAPFVGAKFTYESEKVTINGTNQNVADLSAAFGAEYFLNTQFSIEGSIGFGFGMVKDKATANQDFTYFGTRTTGVSANFYF